MELENNNAQIEETPENNTEPAEKTSIDAKETGSDLAQTLINNGVTREELKEVLREFFPEQKESTEAVVSRYFNNLRGDGSLKKEVK